MMDGDELLARMLATSVSDRQVTDWPEVLADYAQCVAALRHKLTAREMETLICAGADFYRTLARAEQYRQASVWNTSR
ncbi:MULTISPECIES: DNA-3-methyladenine glycosylase [Achromobacter]|nr:DNA-3-methyladenine glycosylase [Achromobacter ruhlandii]MCV6796572.1 DNA-3-methyladenine glycosylase [Achromobacter ruhlandii]MCV6803702.1 DNA-3-methyladenine glycosylase [Achromobacter ruhlandii]MCV6812694.1 DNA-3-methyladenine glycosylase [Achromobacter ruhlandii]MCV6821196.1 DNA-3-methyladenine glycosylase [Achromobacter ruhlandii]MEB6662110.1 DNA-3-methyladenine glycosylase [Achromobacter ruhlandii]